MNVALRTLLLVSALGLLCFVLYLLRKQRFNLKYSLVWLFSCVGMVVIVLFPNIVDWFGKLIGIQTPVNTVFLIILFFVILLLISLTAIVTKLQKRIRVLIQHVAILEKERMISIKNNDSME